MTDFQSNSHDSAQLTPDSNPADLSQTVSPDTQSLERIKELLFGDRVTQIMQHLNEVDSRLSQRLTHLEQRVDEQIGAVSQQFSQALEVFHQQSAQELASIREDITRAYAQQTSLEGQMKQSLRERSTQLEQTIQSRTTELTTDYTHQTNALRQDLQQLQNIHTTLKSKLSDSLLKLAQEI